MNLGLQCSSLLLLYFHLGKQMVSFMLPNVLQQQHLLFFLFSVSEDIDISHVALKAAFNINYNWYTICISLPDFLNNSLRLIHVHKGGFFSSVEFSFLLPVLMFGPWYEVKSAAFEWNEKCATFKIRQYKLVYPFPFFSTRTFNQALIIYHLDYCSILTSCKQSCIPLFQCTWKCSISEHPACDAFP